MKNVTLITLAAMTFVCLGGLMAREAGFFARFQRAVPRDTAGLSDNDGRQLVSAPQTSDSVSQRDSDSSDERTGEDRRDPVPGHVPQGEGLGAGASLNGWRPFPDDDPWNQDISDRPVDPLSEILVASIGIDRNLHPDFGSGTWHGSPVGIPYIVVTGDQPKVPVMYTDYGDESDRGPFPIPPNAPIEGHPNTDGDRHVIVIDRDNWKLYELFRAFRIADGKMWRAACGATFDLQTNTQRPEGWTSADAAGLPIFPGLVRYDEVVQQGEIRHALRFTCNNTRRAYVPPASHWASRSKDVTLPPMGMRVRLKRDVDISGFPAEAQVILRALKKYGMILADNGSDWFLSGAPDPRWDNDALHTLKRIHGRDFEVIRMDGLVADQ